MGVPHAVGAVPIPLPCRLSAPPLLPGCHPKGKKVILVLASGGVFSEGPWKSWHSVEPYLRQILGFIGIEDVQTVWAEGMNIPPLAIHAVPNGENAVDALVI